MDTTILVKQFADDHGAVFLEVIRTSPEPIRAQAIKALLVEAGVKKADVDRRWTAFQRALKLHPQITAANGKYGWSVERKPARDSLDVLAGNLLAKLPPWLVQPLVQNVAAALDAGESTVSGPTSHEFEEARLVADLAVAVEVLQSRGDTIAEVAKLLMDETRRKRLWPLGRPGETVPFDPDSHEAEVTMPNPGTVVRVVRSGYLWRGGGEPVVAAKAVVAL
ncbi:hypothetical protein ACWT_2118 [Actinoplanes sp. SE50]|uniref:hypothetical protein n=1 Tax=unclassified Actinoplanes TaxID=2626549 RepID=UPI00023EC921|nr:MULTISPECIES: hypothetical protein [unclassified Actinoplanes]AEV83139.1 hypothetical protein ACPL_2242 [Actinoplanes sp. SE50/110]ATO81533.1 hypothetical protein ACWT_2118 [Actinoplanes sp. SE50]SLL98940.1 uncharacterized protein ACSP50_2167 [Actinoplanes sp. SE50/110]